jgi:hypothetical protein
MISSFSDSFSRAQSLAAIPRLLLVLSAALALALTGCGSGGGSGDPTIDGNGNGGGDGSGGGDGNGGGGGDGGGGGGDGGGGGSGCVPREPPTECSNCIDDDEDGFIDGADPECTSILDNDESSFATGIPGDNMDPHWQDCFFDGNSGSGDDKCRYHTCCLIGGCNPGQQANSCTVTQACIDNCGGLAVPGCDCFGCCTLCDDQGCLDVVTNPAIAPNCTYAEFRDPSKCPPCTKSQQCGTPCDPMNCILCPGQTPDDLPPECTEPTCPDNLSRCENTSDCGPNQFCSNGCCIFQIP